MMLGVPVRKACCCPAFLIAMAGPNIISSSAVFADRLIAQTLTDYISVVPCLLLPSVSCLIWRAFAHSMRCLSGLMRDKVGA